MNSEKFLMLLPDSMGSVDYMWESKQATPQKQQEGFIDSYTSEAMHALVQQAIFNPGSTFDPSVEFMKARDAGRKLMEDSGFTTIEKSIEIQVGNKECLDYLIKLENSPEFKGWVNPSFIQAFKTETKFILSNNNK
jgi:hypothetical protein